MPPVTRKQAQQQQLQNVIRTVDNAGNQIVIKPSATGLGTHTTWVYPDANATESSQQPSELSDWPSLSSLDSLTDSEASIESDPPQTPPRGSWTAESVLGTPRKLQRSPLRIGGHGINFWGDGSGVVTQNIINGAELFRGEAVPSTSGLDRDQAALMIKRREKELIEMMANLEDDSMSSDEEIFDGATRHFSPDGTDILSGTESSDGEDTDMESTDGEDTDMDSDDEDYAFDVLQEEKS